MGLLIHHVSWDKREDREVSDQSSFPLIWSFVSGLWNQLWFHHENYIGSAQDRPATILSLSACYFTHVMVMGAVMHAVKVWLKLVATACLSFGYPKLNLTCLIGNACACLYVVSNIALQLFKRPLQRSLNPRTFDFGVNIIIYIINI